MKRKYVKPTLQFILIEDSELLMVSNEIVQNLSGREDSIDPAVNTSGDGGKVVEGNFVDNAKQDFSCDFEYAFDF